MLWEVFFIPKVFISVHLAIIENEFGEVGVDDSLIRNRFKTDEDIFEMYAQLSTRPGCH